MLVSDGPMLPPDEARLAERQAEDIAYAAERERVFARAEAEAETAKPEPLPGRPQDPWVVECADGVVERLHFDESADTFTVERIADVEPLIEHNKWLANQDDAGWSPTREWRRVASFPPLVIDIYKTLWGADPLAKGNEKLLKRMLNDPDLRHFRTAPGRV